MTIRRNERYKVQIVPQRKDLFPEGVGSLINDTLNVVSPSFRGPAFVPQVVGGKQDVINLIGNERQNLYGHLYDQLHYYTPNQGFDNLNIWFDNGGENAVHTRVLGISKNESNAGFAISDNEGMHLVFSTFDDKTLSLNIDDNFSYIKELGLSDNDEHYFMSHVIFTPEGVNTTITESSENIASQASLEFSNDNKTITSYDFYNSLSNKKPINSRTIKKDNLFSTRIKDDLHFMYSKFSHNVKNEKIKTYLHTITDEENFKSFNSDYKTAVTPWVTSQPLDRSTLSNNRENIDEHVANLFRIWSLDDGEVGNRYKIKINPVFKGDLNNTRGEYSIFEVYVFEYDARVNEFTLLESYQNLNLNPDSVDYIARRIGNKYKYYDKESGKVFEQGEYDRVSAHIRVEINSEIENKKIKRLESLVPSGFRAYPHIDVSSFETTNDINLYSFPVKFYRKYNDVSEIDGINNTWGVQMYNIEDNVNAFPVISRYDNNIVKQDGYSDFISPHYFHAKFFNENIWVQDDKFLNNFFHLEKICFNDNISQARYNDSGSTSSLPNDFDYLNIDEIDFLDLQNKISFDMFTFGGFDGVNILNQEEKFITNKGLIDTFYSDTFYIYNSILTGINQTTKYENCNGTILCVPDVSTDLIHKFCVERLEGLTRYIYIADIKDFQIDATFNNTEYTPSRYYNIDYQYSDYFKDESQISAYSLEETKSKMISLINNQTFDFFDSKIFFPAIGDFIVTATSMNETIVTKYISPVTFVTGLFANFNSLKYNVSSITPRYVSSLGITSEFSYIDMLKLRLNSDFENIHSESIKNILFRLNINSFTSNSNISMTSPGLITAHSYTGNSFNINRKINITRSIQYIKNRIMIDLYTNQNIVTDTVLFNSTSSLENIFQKINLQLNILLTEILSEGINSGFKVNIDPNYISNNFNDIVNHKIKGNIIIQFGQSNIIDLDLDNVLSELNESLTENKDLVIPRAI